MNLIVKTLLLFTIGLGAGVFFFASSPELTAKSVSNHLPELVFPKTSPSVSIIFTGDVMLGRSVNTRILKNNDFSWPFIKISSVLADADITIINLESPFNYNCPQTDKGMIFCADPKSILGLTLSGIDIATLANNHIDNQGEEGKVITKNNLEQNGVTSIFHGELVHKTVGDTKIAFLAFSDFPKADENEIEIKIQEATLSANIVVTTFHWGYEYQKTPNDRQQLLAHLAIDAGSDIVVGHHPHWIQTEEVYQGKPIFYSLGNLVFDQMWSEETRQGQILKVHFENSLVVKKEIFPVKIFDYGQPQIVSDNPR